MRRTTSSSVESWRSVVSSWASSASLKTAAGGGDGKRAHQPLKRLEIEPVIAPFRGRNGREDVAFDRRDNVRIEVGRVARHPESAILAETAGATGDLSDLLRIEGAQAPPVEFAQSSKGDMVDIHVQSHPNRVGRDQEIDLAGLEQSDLRVAGAGAQRAHDHRRAPALAADELGDGVDRVSRERDDGAASRQTRQFLGTGVGELGKSFAELDLDSRTKLTDQSGDGRRAHQHGLGCAARVQEPVGEHMPAFRVGAKLDLIDGEKFDLAIQRHRLDRADEIARPGRHDLLFAGNQRDLGRAPRLDHPIVDLARQEPQGKADHARGVPQHALDRQMRLARVGGAQNRDEPRGVP